MDKRFVFPAVVPELPRRESLSPTLDLTAAALDWALEKLGLEVGETAVLVCQEARRAVAERVAQRYRLLVVVLPPETMLDWAWALVGRQGVVSSVPVP
jgi:hypothetical protein